MASLVTLDSAGKVEDLRIGITGAGPVPYRARAVEVALRGKAPTDTEVSKASALAAKGIDTLSDIHASGDYRREMASVYTRRSIENASVRARGERSSKR